jgi:sugar phosphate isomerase/epimerase
VAAEEGKAIEIGRGVINFPELIKALKKVQYKGVCSIEYEKDMGDPLAGIAESTGYFRAVVAAG